MQKHKIAKLAAVVYFIQGALGISAVAMPVFFRRLGWSVSDIAVIASLASLPWIFKIVFGFLSDSIPVFGYRRKSYLFFYLACSVVGWCAVSFWGTEKWMILISLWVANLGFAGTDVITDGLIVEHSEGEWSRIFQSIAWGFRSFGSIVTGMLGGWLMLNWEPRQIFLMTAILPLFAVIPVWRVVEERVAGGSISAGVGTHWVELWRFCFQRSLFFFVFFLFCSTSSSLFGTPFFFYLKENLFFPDDYLGFLISLGWAGAAAGSVVFGLWMKKVPFSKLFIAVIFLNTLNVLSTYAVRGVDSAAWLIFWGGLAAGVMILPLMSAAALISSRSGIEGTLFAILMGLFNLSQILWGIIGAKLLPYIKLNGLIGLAALIQLSAFFFISGMKSAAFFQGGDRMRE